MTDDAPGIHEARANFETDRAFSGDLHAVAETEQKSSIVGWAGTNESAFWYA
jgi:hypothetical protein